MKQIGMIYGSDGGYTQNVCQRLAEYFGVERIDMIEVVDTSVEQISSYDFLIFASSTWHDGHLQDDWNDFSQKLDEVDFSNKTIALLSLGDQDGYGSTFCDSLGCFYEKVKAGKIVGSTSTNGYDFEESTGVMDGEFIGLCIDEDNQDDMTDERLKNWYEDIKGSFEQ